MRRQQNLRRGATPASDNNPPLLVLDLFVSPRNFLGAQEERQRRVKQEVSFLLVALLVGANERVPLFETVHRSSKLVRVGRSLIRSFGNDLSGAKAPHETMTNLSYQYLFLQQQRTFIQMRTRLKVVDNSGAKRVMCIQALKGRRGARLGDTIIASVKEAQPHGKVKKGDVVYGVVVRAAMQRSRCDGSEIRFDDNAVVLVNKQGEPIGTRIYGPVPHELRKKKHVKILTLAEHIA
ncbi:unnamed protein product [Musa hybrid cultivar]